MNFKHCYSSVLLLLSLLCSSTLYAQNEPPPNPATNLPVFSIQVSALSFGNNHETAPGTDIGATFQVTPNWALRSDNILVPGMSTQGYFGGLQYGLPALSKALANTNLDPTHFQFYITGSLGHSVISVNGVDSSHFASLLGGGVNYDPTGTKKFSLNIIEARWARFPGIANNTVILSTTLKLGF